MSIAIDAVDASGGFVAGAWSVPFATVYTVRTILAPSRWVVESLALLAALHRRMRSNPTVAKAQSETASDRSTAQLYGKDQDPVVGLFILPRSLAPEDVDLISVSFVGFQDGLRYILFVYGLWYIEDAHFFCVRLFSDECECLI